MKYYYNLMDGYDERDRFYNEQTVRRFRVYPATPEIEEAALQPGSGLFPVHFERRHPMASEAQRRAIQNYKKKLKRITLEFSPAETDMWDYIQQQEKKQTYIKRLIREDMKKDRG